MDLLSSSLFIFRHARHGNEPVDLSQLAVCEQLRRLHLTVWYALYAERLPDLQPRAAELLALWPEP